VHQAKLGSGRVERDRRGRRLGMPRLRSRPDQRPKKSLLQLRPGEFQCLLLCQKHTFNKNLFLSPYKPFVTHCIVQIFNSYCSMNSLLW
jgi:hypothetical protein